MSQTPKVTIGIPFRNPGKYFALALKSVFAQTFSDWELILMDDGSLDDALTLARSVNDPRVRVYSDGINKRMNVRFNELVSLARAPYFFRMDADDIMHPERIERQYEVLVRNRGNTVVGSGAYSLDAGSNIVGVRRTGGKRSGVGVCQSFIHPSVAAATEWFRQNPYSESIAYYRCQDSELWSRTASNSTFITISDPLLYYREAGVFSYENYVGAQMGHLVLLQARFGRPRLSYFVAVVKCLAKTLLVCVADVLGCEDVIVARRYTRLTSGQRRHAEEGLARVLSCPLPI
jgi:glycosyltransferase involved in cell wall biosynthesis